MVQNPESTSTNIAKILHLDSEHCSVLIFLFKNLLAVRQMWSTCPSSNTAAWFFVFGTRLSEYHYSYISIRGYACKYSQVKKISVSNLKDWTLFRQAYGADVLILSKFVKKMYCLLVWLYLDKIHVTVYEVSNMLLLCVDFKFSTYFYNCTAVLNI